MDALTITSIVMATASLITSVLTHIRYSSCFGMKVVAFHSKNDEPTTPLLKK